MLPTVEESRGYDFLDPENAEKWRGLFVNPLRKVLENVHPELTAEETALEYVESLCLRLLGTLCAQPMPLTVQDVEERINRAHGGAVGRCALAEAAEAAHGKKWKGILPQERLQTLLKEVLMYKIDTSVSIYMTAILEHVSGEVLKLAGNYIKKISQRGSYNLLSCRDIKTAMCADKVLMGLFSGDPEMAEGAPPAPAPAPAHARRGSLSYTELVRDLLTDEKHALRDLHLIIRVFKDELERILDKDPKTIALIFGNIVDIYELTVTLLGNLEDAIEMSQDSPTPYIGSCFEELAEVEEFRAYVRYANIVTRHDSRQALQQLVDDPGVSERLETAGRGFRLAVKYYLPRLLLAPVAHVFLYHSYVLAFLRVAPASDDRESFKQVECNLHPIKKILANALANGPKHDTQLPVATRTRRQLAIEKCQELARTVDNWDGRDVAQCCSEFVREDTLVKLGPGRRAAERRAFLFDGLLLLCKPVPGATTGNSTTALLGGGGGGAGGGGGGGGLLKLKEKLHVRKLELLEHADTDEARHCIEVSSGGTSLVLGCASAADRRAWLADLVMLSTKPMLDRALDSILADLERRHPLQLPPASLYRFAIPDSPDNIVLEEHKGATPAPLIKGATLIKLVERLTYHIYADLNLVRTFLTTYRSFCSPAELLALLVERFRIPEPGQVYDPPHPESIESIASDAEKLSKNSTREDWKRYRKEFEQPVKFRVINVLRHWVDQHFYDFERDPPLLQQLKEFLESVDGKPMKKWVQSVLKTLQRKSAAAAAADAELGVCHVFDRPAPALLRHLHDPERCDWHPLALHPVELARQLTVLEFQLYRQVKPSELVGAVWTKKDKEKTSPNLLRIIKHTTNFTRWMEKWIVCSENLEERVGVVCRLLALASALHALHNFNAVLACVCAAGSASVHRLARTWQLVPPRLLRVLQALRELNSDHFRRYQERLRSINPPCVPFLGMYLTNILHIEEGNLDYLPNSELINFSKRRKVAEITGEIQQYQNQPYCLTVEPKTRAFLESLDPFPGMDDNEITNYLYAQSLHIEPRTPAKPLPKFPRRYPELSLKLVKLSRRAADQQPPDDNISVSQLSPTGSSMWGDGASVCSLPIHQDDRGPRSEERGSLISPRLERSSSHTFSQLSLLDKGLALFDKTARSSTSRSSSGRDEPPSPRGRHSPRRSRPPSAERRPPALSPRAPIVDADLFYCQDHRSEERVPPLLPRNSITMQGADEPPRVPRRPNDDIPPSLPPAPGSEPPASPPERPPPSPKHQDLVSSTLARMPTLSPKRSPAPQPPSPHVAADRALAFSFPARGAPAPSPPAPPLTPHPVSSASSACGTPPPLPPRRRRDSAAPPTPAPPAPAPAPAPAAAPAPPPLPPRPPPPPELLRPAHSTILQRRHHTSTTAPQLPPKPPPPAVAPRT